MIINLKTMKTICFSIHLRSHANGMSSRNWKKWDKSVPTDPNPSAKPKNVTLSFRVSLLEIIIKYRDQMDAHPTKSISIVSALGQTTESVQIILC